MSRGRRKTIILVVESVALGLVILDVALYFALVRPLRILRASEEANYGVTRDRVRDSRARIARLEKYQAAVPGAEEELASFLKDHISARRQGFSRAVRFVRESTDKAGLRLVGVSYKLDSSKGEPFERLAVQVEAEGSFSNLLDFAHALETSSDLIVLRDFSFEPTEARNLTLRLEADLYLKR